MFLCVLRMRAVERQARDNVVKKLDFSREHQDQNANVTVFMYRRQTVPSFFFTPLVPVRLMFFFFPVFFSLIIRLC